MENELKINRCRKCKHTAHKTYDHVDCYTTLYGIKCDSHSNDCTNSISGCDTQEEAIKFWNEHNNI